MNLRILVTLSCTAVGLSGCATASMAAAGSKDGTTQERSGSMFSSAPTILAPKTDRCEAQEKVHMRQGCERQKQKAAAYTHRLSVGDTVCLEGGLRDPIPEDCRARAVVVDSASGRILFEVREAHPDSKWFSKLSSQVWYEEGALVDLYLAENGW